MTSITITVSGSNSVLTTHFFPPIELDNPYEYECGLIDFQSFHSIPNIDECVNKIYIGNNEIVLPTGTYEIDDINYFIREIIREKHLEISFSLFANKNTLHSEIFCSHPIDFTKNNSIGPLLGFSRQVLSAEVQHISNNIVNIFKVSAIRIECDLIRGSYFNHKETHTLHQFFPTVAPGYKIVETPRNVIYFPITKSTIDSVTLTILDQDSHAINFRGENITTRIHIRKVGT